MLAVSRRLHLGKPADREYLRQLLAATPDIPSELADVVDAHASLFTDDDWRAVHSGGLSFRGQSIVSLLQNTQRLLNLSRFGDVDHFLTAMRVPHQLSATMFEVIIADWLTSRSIHRKIVFEPAVVTKSSVKHPEMLWSTPLGDLHVECKLASPYLTKRAAQLGRLATVAKDEYERPGHAWPSGSRVDLLIAVAALNGCEKRIQSVIQQLAGASVGAIAENGEVSGTVVLRESNPAMPHGHLRQEIIEVGPVATKLDVHSSYLSLGIPLRKAVDNQLRALLRAARRQLPPEGRGAIMIDIPAEFLGILLESTKELVAQSAYARTPFIGLFDGQQLHCIWRSDSPFDGRVTVPA